MAGGAMTKKKCLWCRDWAHCGKECVPCDGNLPGQCRKCRCEDCKKEKV